MWFLKASFRSSRNGRLRAPLFGTRCAQPCACSALRAPSVPGQQPPLYSQSHNKALLSSTDQKIGLGMNGIPPYLKMHE